MKLLILFMITVLSSLIYSERIKWKRLIKSKNIDFPMHRPLSFDLINYVNILAKTTWKAGLTDRFQSIFDIQNVLGVIKDPSNFRLPKKEIALRHIPLPTSFDARLKWPLCKSIKEIRDQGSCGSCYVFGGVEAMTDRYCIHSNGTQTHRISAEDLLTCCGSKCGNGCFGGYHDRVWEYWVTTGIVTGGEYGSHIGCQDYAFPKCSHKTIGPYPKCSRGAPTPKCKMTCQSGYPKSYKEDKHFGKSAYSIPNSEKHIMQEIFINGPVEGSINVYADFFNYKSGIYQHVTGARLGDHAIKIIGWGVERNTSYWLVANSFNPTWGEEGFFRIKKGSNECNVESDISGGLPRL